MRPRIVRGRPEQMVNSTNIDDIEEDDSHSVDCRAIAEIIAITSYRRQVVVFFYSRLCYLALIRYQGYDKAS